jgi:hypothetical protein
MAALEKKKKYNLFDELRLEFHHTPPPGAEFRITNISEYVTVILVIKADKTQDQP